MKPANTPLWIIVTLNAIMNAAWWLWSQCVNIYLWRTEFRGKWDAISLSMNTTRDQVKSIEDVQRKLSVSEWKADKYLDWFPWVHTIFAECFIDDCDGAAVYGKFLLSCLKIKSRRVKLIEPTDSWKFWDWTYHIIQVSNDKRYFASNGELVNITIGLDTEHFEADTIVTNWKQFIRLYFLEGGDNYKWVL